MNTPTFTTPRHQAAAAALALCLTIGMLLSVNGLAAHGVADAQQVAAAASTQVVVAPHATASGV